ncbi:piRNA biogenesis protein EXD1 [Centroberyx gerrardi]
MTVDDFQFADILKGKRIKLTLKTASYLGVVQRINPNKTVVLADVVNDQNGRKFPGLKMFFGHEIVNVEFPGETKSANGKIPHHKFEDHLTVEEFQPYRKSIIFDDDEGDEEFINFVVIDGFHEKFGPAVMHIKKQQVIGVGADGVEVFQHRKLCWLQIATKNKVYLFDILLLGARAFKNGLSMILENEHILKVIHDCRDIAGCLTVQFGVNLINVFDTQVADVMCFYSETGGFLPDRVSTLQEVVSLHLKVPSSRLSSLQMKSQLTKEEREMWYKRPCPVPLLKVMALSAIHLQPLRLVLLDALMTDYVGLVGSYLNSSHIQPGEMEHISMDSALELPRELRELEHMRQERQEWAADRYPVTEQGLLARFQPRPQPLPQTSPPAEQHIQDPVPQIKPNSPEPATVEPPSPAQVDTFYHQLSTNPPWMASPVQSTAANPAAVQPTPDPVAQVTVCVSDLRKQPSLNSFVSPAASQGLMEVVMDTMGSGRPVRKDLQPSFPVFPSIGRGFSLQIPPAQVPRESPGDMKTPGRMEMAPPSPSSRPAQEVRAQPVPKPNVLLGNMGGGHFIPTPQSLSSPLSQSFSFFRKT